MNADGIKILLVDDHILFRKGLASLIREQKDMAVVGEAATRQEAIDLARSLSPNVVIMDIHLESDNGIHISQAILEEFPGIKIIVVSADFNLSLVNDALKAGVSGYFIKRNAPGELLTAIRSVRDQRIFLSPEVAQLVVSGYMQMLGEKSIPASQPVLTERERLLLKLVAEGRRSKEIAESLGVEVKSVDTYRSRLMRKLGCSTSNELTRYAIKEGITKI